MRFPLLAPLLPAMAAMALALAAGGASAQTADVPPGYVVPPASLPPPAIVAPAPPGAVERNDYVTPPGVTMYDVPAPYGGTITKAAPTTR